jgi:antitoxin YefM
MTTLSATEARTKLYRLIDQASISHEPIVITGKRGNAVLISEDDWRSIQETIYLLNIPGMGELESCFYKTGRKRCKKIICLRAQKKS